MFNQPVLQNHFDRDSKPPSSKFNLAGKRNDRKYAQLFYQAQKQQQGWLTWMSLST